MPSVSYNIRVVPKTNRAERLNRLEDDLFKYRLEYINWQKDTRQKLYDLKIEKLRQAIELLPHSTGRSTLSEHCSTDSLPEDYPKLLLGYKRYRHTLNQGVELASLTTPTIRRDTKQHIGWDLRNQRQRHLAPLGAVDEPKQDADIFGPMSKIFRFSHLTGEQRMGKSIRDIRLAQTDDRLVAELAKSDQRILKYIQREEYVCNKLEPILRRQQEAAKLEARRKKKHLRNKSVYFE